MTRTRARAGARAMKYGDYDPDQSHNKYVWVKGGKAQALAMELIGKGSAAPAVGPAIDPESGRQGFWDKDNQFIPHGEPCRWAGSDPNCTQWATTTFKGTSSGSKRQWVCQNCKSYLSKNAQSQRA